MNRPSIFSALASHLVEVAEVVRGAAVSPGVAGGRDDLLEIDVDRRLRLLPFARGTAAKTAAASAATHLNCLVRLMKPSHKPESPARGGRIKMFPSTGPDARP